MKLTDPVSPRLPPFLVKVERTVDAVQRFAAENGRAGSQHYERWLETEHQLREQLRQLLNAGSSDEIALLKNTSEALSVVAYGLDWRAGDEIVISDQEFPSNRIVWESLAPLGIKLIQVDMGNSTSPEQALIAALTPKSRLLSVSSVQYASGLALDLELLGAECRRRGVIFCVDAIQSIGVKPFDVQVCQADFVMADGHKWMLGPEGLAVFYCRREWIPRLALCQFGWHMVEAVGDYDRKDWRPAASARRFECGSPNMTGIHALHASLSLIEETGMTAIEARILDNSRFLMDFFLEHREQHALLTPPAAGRHAGIVTFRPRNETPQEIFERLTQSRVSCALRGGGVRFSPHYYTPREQLAGVLALLEAPA